MNVLNRRPSASQCDPTDAQHIRRGSIALASTTAVVVSSTAVKDDRLIIASARAIQSLAPAVSGLANLSAEIAAADRAIRRGYFTPDEDELVRDRFAHYLGARAALLQTIHDLEPIALADPRGTVVDSDTRLRAFVIGYTAVCLLVRAASTLIDQLAGHSLVQRKLNEAEPCYGIGRKQYTSIYKSLTNPRNALRIREVRQAADQMRDEIDALADDPLMAPVIVQLREAEPFVQRRFRDYARMRLRYRLHSWRRRRASAAQQALFTMMELVSRVIADIHNPFAPDRLTGDMRRCIEDQLEPGDVLITRHDTAFSNLFLPGFWPHSSLHIGPAARRDAMRIEIDHERAARWVDPIRVLEARKDGVLFRPLTDTLAVDAALVLRPMLDSSLIARALSRAVRHEGKLYDFEFDFNRSDRLVCTEVVYRAYHGLGGIEFQLSQRAGKTVLTAEDIVTLALHRRGFEAVLLYGADRGDESIYSGDDAMTRLTSIRAASDLPRGAAAVRA